MLGGEKCCGSEVKWKAKSSVSEFAEVLPYHAMQMHV